MLRTSYSQILNSSRDFSTAIFDSQSRLVAQAEHLPIHVGALPSATQAVEDRFGGDIAPGDVILMNDPYSGGSHLPDVTVFVPVFGDGERRFWTVVRAHMADIGGATHGGYNPQATEIWQEGLRIPLLKLIEAGRLRSDVMDLLALNVRFGREFRGDLEAMIGAAHSGERSLTTLISEYGVPTIVAATELMFDASERMARNVVSEWKDGTYIGEAFLDDDGHGREDLKISVTVTKSGSDLEFDLTASDPQTSSFANSPRANTQSAVCMAFAYLLDLEIPKNHGCFRPLTIHMKPGTIVCPNGDAPVALGTVHPANEIVEAAVRALAPACPDRAMGGWGRRFRVSITGDNPRNGRRFIWHMFHARPGGGASSQGDGWSSGGEWTTVGGIKFGSIEVAEARFPLLFQSHEFLPGSAGDGRYVGGLGAKLDLQIETEAYAHTAGEGAKYGAAGVLGGKDGAPHRYRLISGDKVRDLKTKEFGIHIGAGDVLEIHSGGGGGWGPPEERDESAKRRDLELGFVCANDG